MKSLKKQVPEESISGDSGGDDPDKFKNQDKDKKGDKDKKDKGQKAYFPAPSTLKGFPNSGKGLYNPKSDRKRWILPDGTILEWDYQHGKVEKYDRNGNHQGEFDPDTGEQTKGPVNGRSTPKFEGAPNPSLLSGWLNLLRLTLHLSTSGTIAPASKTINPTVFGTAAGAALTTVIEYGWPVIAF